MRISLKMRKHVPISVFSAPIARNVGLTMASGFCVPSSCSPELASDIAQALLPNYDVTSRSRAERFCYQHNSHLDARDILGMYIPTLFRYEGFFKK